MKSRSRTIHEKITLTICNFNINELTHLTKNQTIIRIINVIFGKVKKKNVIFIISII